MSWWMWGGGIAVIVWLWHVGLKLLAAELEMVRNDIQRTIHLRHSEVRMIEQAKETNRLLRILALRAGVETEVIYDRSDKWEVSHEEYLAIRGERPEDDKQLDENRVAGRRG